MTLNSAFVGNEGAGLAAFTAWLGKPTGAVQIHGGMADAADYVSSIGWLLQAPRIGVPGPHIPIFTVPLFPPPQTLASAASGACDVMWRQIAQTIAKAYPTGPVFIRMGEELNGDWMPWAVAPGDAAAALSYVTAWRRFHDVFKAVGPHFLFDWCLTYPWGGVLDIHPCYPGDAYADVLSMDVYYKGAWAPADPVAAFNQIVSAPFGLYWLADQAKNRRKLLAIHEWGFDRDVPVFVTAMAAWIKANGVVYQGLWNEPGSVYEIDKGQYPLSAAAYKAAF